MFYLIVFVDIAIVITDNKVLFCYIYICQRISLRVYA